MICFYFQDSLYCGLYPRAWTVYSVPEVKRTQFSFYKISRRNILKIIQSWQYYLQAIFRGVEGVATQSLQGINIGRQLPQHRTQDILHRLAVESSASRSRRCCRATTRTAASLSPSLSSLSKTTATTMSRNCHHDS